MIKNLALLLIATVLSVALLEVMLRALGPGNEVPYVLDKTLIYRPGPNRKLRYVRFPEEGGEVITTRFNTFGFRGEDFPVVQEGTLRVFVYGDSLVQASYSREEDTFSAQLQARLAAAVSKPLRVVNAGVDGYGPDQVLLRLRQELPVFAPDLIVVTLFADNDFGDPVRNKVFRLDKTGALERNHFVLSKEVRRHYAERERLDTVLALHKAWLEPALLRRDLRILLERRLSIVSPWLADVPIDSAYRTGQGIDWIETWRKRGLQEFREFVLNGDPEIHLDNIRSDHYDADVATEPNSPSALYKLRLMDRLLAALTELLGSRDVPMLLLVVPSPIDVCDGYDWQVDRARYPDYDRRLLSTAIEQTAKKLKVPVLNLFDAYRGQRCNDMYFHHGNNHWTAQGQALAADLASEEIIAYQLLRRR
jgi:hypothetical protein